MPKIPTYESSVGINVGSTPEASLAPVKASERAQAGAVQAIENAEDAIYKVRSFREKSEASAYAFQALQEQISLSDEDIGFDSSKYEQAIDKIGQEAGRTITAQLDKDEFAASFQRQAIAAKFSIRNKFRERELESAKATLEYRGQTIIDTYGSLDEAGRITALSDYRKQLEDAVKIGIYNQPTADAKLVKFTKDLSKAVIDTDISRDTATDIKDSFVYAQLKLGKDGEYALLTDQQRAESIETIQKKVRRNQILFQFQDAKNKDQNEAKMIVSLADGGETPESIKKAVLSGDIRNSFGEKALKRVYSDPTVKTDYRVYNQVREMQYTDASVETINQFILDHADKLSQEDIKILIDKSYAQADVKQRAAIRYNAQALKEWASSAIDDDGNAASVVYEFHRRINAENASGQRVDQIAQDLQKETIKALYPPTALIDDVPNFVASRNRIKKVYARESKQKGRASTPKATLTGASSGIDFDDL
jgi:hypothetical protein